MSKAKNNVTLAPVPAPVENVVNLVTPVEPAPYPALLPAVETAPKVKLLPVPVYNDASIITGILSPIPKRPGSGAWDRYACYREGITVGEYKAACPQKKGNACIRWDLARGLITLK